MMIPGGKGLKTAMLDFRHVAHAYNGSLSVDEVSFSVERGEVVTLLGPSGCGKTTMLRLAAGLERPRGGEIWLDGTLLSDAAYNMPPEDRGVGYMFQDYALFPHLSVLENVVFGLKNKGSAAIRRALDVLAETDLEFLADAYPHELSGGQQQRVALARALAPKPSVILLDEPSTGMDPVAKRFLWNVISDLYSNEEKSVILTSHSMAECEALCSRIGIMVAGR